MIGLKQRFGDVTCWLGTQSIGSDFYGVMAGDTLRGTGLMVETVYADAVYSYGMYEIGSVLGGNAFGGPLLSSQNGQTYAAGVLSGGTSRSANYAGLHASGN